MIALIKDLEGVGNCCYNLNLNMNESIGEFECLNMSFRHHLDAFTHGRILRKAEEGRQVTDASGIL